MKKLTLLAFFGLTAFLSLQGQTEPVAEETTEADKAPAHIRVWSMVFGDKAPISVQLVRSDSQPQPLLEGSGEKPIKVGYQEVPKGDVEIRLNSGGVLVSSAKLKLRPGDYQTLLVFKKGSRLQMDVLQDPLPGQKDFPPTIRFLNFGTGRDAEITVGKGSKVTVADNSYVLSPYTPKGDVELFVSLPDPAGGPAATSITDVNASSPSWSVVMVPDYRGRIRPMVTADGRE